MAIDLLEAKQAADEIKAGTREFALPETYDIDNVPIFAAGKWNGDNYTESDLDEMVASFNETKGTMKPYLKLGHDDGQKLLQQDGLPAAGWIDSLHRQGRTLYAKFSRVPKKIMDLVKAGAYRRVSSEIYFGMEVQGKKFGKLLKAVSLLGGDTPAVHTLDDIIALYALGGEVKVYEGEATVKSVNYELVNIQERLEIKMNEKLQEELTDALKAKVELEAQVKTLSEKAAAVESLTNENAALKASLEFATKQVGELETEKAKFTEEKRIAEVNGMLDEAVKNKKITPAQKPMLYTLMMNASVEKRFKMGDKEQSADEILKAFMDSNTVQVNTEEESGAGEKRTDDDLHAKVLAYRETHKGVSYKAALLAVSPSNEVEGQ